MKASIITMSLMSCVFIMNLNVYSAIYTDNCSDSISDSIRQYYNLSEFSFSYAGSSVPDPSALSFANTNSPIAWATYRVNGASEVVAGVYSTPGTFISLDAGTTSYYLGVFKADMPQGAIQQAFYSYNSNAVYLSGGAQQVYTDGLTYKFGPVITPPSGTLIGYGVNFYYSADGQSFVRITHPSHTSLVYRMPTSASDAFCYEEYAASVPASAKYIRVEINDVASLPLESGGTIAKSRKSMTALAKVSISGSSLVMGDLTESPSSESLALPPQFDPDFFQKAETPVQSQSAAEDSSDEKILAAQNEAKVSGKSESSKSSSAKFEGTITSSQKSSRAASKSSSQSKSVARPSSSSSEPPPESEYPREEETLIYEIRREDEGKRFSGAVTAYIAVVTAALFLVILSPKKK